MIGPPVQNLGLKFFGMVRVPKFLFICMYIKWTIMKPNNVLTSYMIVQIEVKIRLVTDRTNSYKQNSCK